MHSLWRVAERAEGRSVGVSGTLRVREWVRATISAIHSQREILGLLGILYILVITFCGLTESFLYSRCRDIQTDFDFNDTEKRIVTIAQKAPGYETVVWLSSIGLERTCPDF